MSGGESVIIKIRWCKGINEQGNEERPLRVTFEHSGREEPSCKTSAMESFIGSRNN